MTTIFLFISFKQHLSYGRTFWQSQITHILFYLLLLLLLIYLHEGKSHCTKSVAKERFFFVFFSHSRLDYKNAAILLFSTENFERDCNKIYDCQSQTTEAGIFVAAWNLGFYHKNSFFCITKDCFVNTIFWGRSFEKKSENLCRRSHLFRMSRKHTAVEVIYCHK